MLLDFLNELLKAEQGHIKNLTYLKTEQLGTLADDRKAIFDISCESEKGEKFIVEYKKPSRISLKTEPFTTPLSQLENKLNVQTGILN